MDWNKLQHTLFALDPTDPAEDLRKLKESAGAANNVAPTKDYVVESVEVAPGSMPVEGNYSIADFATLAGITLTESQKTGSAGQLKSNDAIKKLPAGTTKNATRDALVGEADDDKMSWRDNVKRGWDNYNTPAAIGIENPVKKILNPKNKEPSKAPAAKSATAKAPVARAGDWRGFLKQHTAGLQQIAADPVKKKRFDTWMAKWNEGVEQPVSQVDNSVESIKEMLLRKLNQSK